MARRLDELPRGQQVRKVALAIGRTLLVWTLLGVAYYLLPLDEISGDHPFWMVLSVVSLFCLAVAWSTVRVFKADLPQLRAAEALGATIPFFLSLFAIVYLVLSFQQPESFSEPLSHLDALYFAVTVFATVGFGDITPTSVETRMVVSLQMLLNLVVLGVVVKIIAGAARRGVSGEKRGSGSD
jgi:hypothetical protein